MPAAEKNGYTPDYWVSPDSVDGCGRPYPYMIFKNMQELKLQDVSRVMKVGDTVSDIKEGKNAGMVSVGIVEGSSVMGLTEEEYNALPEAVQDALYHKVAGIYYAAGADHVVKDIRGILHLIK